MKQYDSIEISQARQMLEDWIYEDKEFYEQWSLILEMFDRGCKQYGKEISEQ